LISITVDLDEIEQARDYLSALQQINKQEESKRVDLISRLGDVLVLRTSKRRKNLSKAEEILGEILDEADEEIVDHQLTIQTLITLSELLLEELHSTGEEDVLVEVEGKRKTRNY